MMKKAISFALCLLMAGTVLSACSNPDEFSDSENLSLKYTRSDKTDDTFNYADGADTAPSSYDTYSAKITDFELRLFRNRHKSGSYVFCPANAVLNLEAVANGASGDTQEEITNALCSGVTLENMNQCASYFASRIQSVASSDKSPESSQSSENDTEKNGAKNFVKLSNSIISNDNADIMTGFLQTTKDYYDTDVLRFDYTSDDALKKLDKKYADFTNSGSVFKNLDAKQSVISLSAADICDRWLNPYAQTDIEKGKFKSADGEKEVTYMTSNETYMKSNKATAVMKYFSQTPLKMMVIMPNEGVSLDDYATDFTSLEYTTLLDSVDVTKTAKAKIPEFSVDGSKSAEDVTQIVEKSGINSSFTADRSSYKNMSRSDDIAFSAMYDIAPSLSINAGGIGGMQSNGDKAELEKRTQKLADTDVTVEFNRPFMFVILDNESDIPLYMGTYTG